MKARILIVDDEEVVIRSCLRGLAGNDYQIDTRMDSRSALSAIDEAHYDLLVMDVMMPHIGGLEVLERVKQSHPDLQVIMITGLAQHETAVRAKTLGAFAYLPKPFDPDQLSQLVQQALVTAGRTSAVLEC